MQPRQGRVHGIVDRRAFCRLRRRHVRLPDDAAFDVIHEIERGSGNAGVVAVKHRRGDRKALRVQRADHAELAIDGVRGREQLARRLSPQHVTARGRLQEVCGIGLTALELAHAERRHEIGEARSEKRFEPRHVDREPAGKFLGSGKRGLAVNRHGDVRGPICYDTFKLIGYALPMDLYHHDQVPFTCWVISEGLLHEPFVVVDVGVQGGEHPRWGLLGEQVRVYGFDAISEAIDRITAAGIHPHQVFHAIALRTQDSERTVFLLESLSEAVPHRLRFARCSALRMGFDGTPDASA
jgi:hypothetical protein